jgi:hypothetical protein
MAVIGLTIGSGFGGYGSRFVFGFGYGLRRLFGFGSSSRRSWGWTFLGLVFARRRDGFTARNAF